MMAVVQVTLECNKRCKEKQKELKVPCITHLCKKHIWKKAETFFCTFPALWPLIHTPSVPRATQIKSITNLLVSIFQLE